MSPECFTAAAMSQKVADPHERRLCQFFALHCKYVSRPCFLAELAGRVRGRGMGSIRPNPGTAREGVWEDAGTLGRMRGLRYTV